MWSAALNPLYASTRTALADTAIDWHSHTHDEFWLVSDGMPLVGCATGKVCAEPGTLFLFTAGETHGLWNYGNTSARLWSLEFCTSAGVRIEFGDLLRRPPERRVLKLSGGQQQRFCNTCQKIAFEKGMVGCLHTTAASVLLALQLVDVARWFVAQPEADVVDGTDKADPQCLELWQKIHRHAFRPTSPGPMLFHLNPGHDSLRHRFRKLFGISPQGLLVRLRMDRAKELLRTGELSVKEIAHEVGYLRQHDFSRAFHKGTGMSPSQWRRRNRDFAVPL
jgi:AraC-like DNA-binding protein